MARNCLRCRVTVWQNPFLPTGSGFTLYNGYTNDQSVLDTKQSAIVDRETI